MAKKRRISRAEATPSPTPVSGSQPETEPASQPETEPASQPETEPMVEETPIIEEPPAIEQQHEEEAAPQDEQPRLAAAAAEIEAAEEVDPQTLENPDPTPDPISTDPDEHQRQEEEEEEKDPSSIQKVLELFPKEQLVELLRDAAGDHPDVLSSIHRLADVDPTLRKIFVHGLGWDTSAESLRAAFRHYGEIEDCNAVTDKQTGKSKGYGFILFKRRSGARNALKEPQKKIGLRMTSCQLASAGPVPPLAPPVSEYTQRKIYVSNVGADLDPRKLLQFFSKFGDIEEGPLGLDKATGKPRGFCLFVYKSVEGARKALEEPHKNFDGHMLHCQKAVDGPKGSKQFQFHQAGPRPNAGFLGAPSAPGPVGHLMAPSGFNRAVPAAGMDPVLGQTLTALLANQGAAGLGLNLLGGLGPAAAGSQGAPMGNLGMQGGGYGNQGFGGGGGYGGGYLGQGGYGNGQGRGQQGYGGRPPYTGH